MMVGGGITLATQTGPMAIAATSIAGAVISSAPKMVSSIKNSTKLVREAKAAGKSSQRSLDHLFHELSKGNLNPGVGTKSIARGVLEARADDGARLYFRIGENSIEILGKSTKANQATVIRAIKEMLGLD
jgi:hypothetical protein